MTKYLINKTPIKTDHNKNMTFFHLFYKEISSDEDNIFSANLTEKNGVEQVKFKKSKIYAINGLWTDQNI